MTPPAPSLTLNSNSSTPPIDFDLPPDGLTNLSLHGPRDAPKLAPKTAEPQPPSNDPLALTGKQEHYLKRELISRQVQFEISELNSPTALQRFGAPFRSPLGEVSPTDSELPILRYIFVNHIRRFPFLDQAKEKEFWQDKLQSFLESFASKRISSSEDRLEETKRRKLALKAEKLVELMMNSGIPTASGYEERITFREIEEAGGPDRQANEKGLMVNIPEGVEINGWDVNVVTVRQTSVKRTVRYHVHPEFVIRSKRSGQPDVVVGRRYGAFNKLHHEIRAELPGKVLPPVPRKMKKKEAKAQQQPSMLQSMGITSMPDADDASSLMSRVTSISSDEESVAAPTPPKSHRKTLSESLGISASPSRNASRTSFDSRVDLMRQTQKPIILWKESQRVTLRAFLRTLLSDPQIAASSAMHHFLTHDPITLNEEELLDTRHRRDMDDLRLEEQRKFFEIATQRARELDVYMEKFRRDIVESNGLTKLFAAIREADTLADLPLQYQKFAEWLRIEVAATIYHIFLAEDNAAEMFQQGKRIHAMIPYTLMKNIIRIANPAAVINGVLDLFLASPWGSRSLMQRIIAVAIRDGIRQLQKSIDSLILKIADPVISSKLEAFVLADESTKDELREEAKSEQMDLVVCILRSSYFPPELTPQQIEKTFNAYVAFNSAINAETLTSTPPEMHASAQYFSNLKQLLKLFTRRRDKNMMLSIIEEPVTLQLFRDLFGIFYEPLIRVYKSANVYNSVTDFAEFVDDMIQVVERAHSMDAAADPNVTVQSFIDLCQRHEDNFYKFVHEVHIHDDGLFENLMAWLEEILSFLRNGPKSGHKLDMNAMFREAAEKGVIDPVKAKQEIDRIIAWQHERRKWHHDKTRQKMATGGGHGGSSSGAGHFGASVAAGMSPKDFGINDVSTPVGNGFLMDCSEEIFMTPTPATPRTPMTPSSTSRSKATSRSASPARSVKSNRTPRTPRRPLSYLPSVSKSRSRASSRASSSSAASKHPATPATTSYTPRRPLSSYLPSFLSRPKTPAKPSPSRTQPADQTTLQSDLDSLSSLSNSDQYGEDDEDDEDEALGDPLAVERRKKRRVKEMLKRKAGEPVKPVLEEVLKMGDGFVGCLREVLSG